MIEYIRPEIDKDESQKIAIVAHQISAHNNFQEKKVLIANMLIELVKLTKECQQHRAALGIKPLEVFDIRIRGKK